MENCVVAFKAENDEKRLVYGEVYAPNRPDAHDNFMTSEDIMTLAHDFMRLRLQDQVDLNHDNNVVGNGVTIVESFVARKGDPDFLEGAWVIGMHIPDDATWEKIKKGELNGFSMEALVRMVETEVEIEIPPVVSGLTSEDEDHEHAFHVAYDDNGTFLGGKTDTVNGHFHLIKRGTVTEVTKGHSHRFSSVDDIEIRPAST